MRTSSALYAVFYKEAIKTRYMMLLLFAANMLYMVWNFIILRRLFMQDHSEVVWYRTINLGQIPYEGMMFVPFITSIIYCIFQFLQEMRDGRIRIALHAPYDSSLIVLLHVLFGATFLGAIFTFDAIILYLSILNYYTPEVGLSALITVLPWFIAGFYIYLGGAFVLLEPQPKRKTLAALVCLGLCIPLFLYRSSGFYVDVLPYFILLIPIMFYSIALSADDYRNRWVA